VSDFGAAQLARSDTTQVAGVGSPAYMSPEQIRGSEEIDLPLRHVLAGRRDVHMLTGARPFGGSTAYELMDEILSKEPPPPSAVNSSISPALDDIVLRALGKSRNDRFDSWNDFAAALEPLLSEEDATLSSLSDVEEFSAMRRLAFFRRFSDTELWEVVRKCRCRKVSIGAELIREGIEDDHIYVLAAGLLKVTQRGKLLNAVSPGECVGEMVYRAAQHGAAQRHRHRGGNQLGARPAHAGHRRLLRSLPRALLRGLPVGDGRPPVDAGRAPGVADAGAESRPGLVVRTRCSWQENPLAIRYHDREWGVPIRSDRKFLRVPDPGRRAGRPCPGTPSSPSGKLPEAFAGFDP